MAAHTPLSGEAYSHINLSENLEHIRRIVIPEDINTLLAERNYLTLAKKMAEIARLANTCSGICFSFYITESRHVPKVGESSEGQTDGKKESDGLSGFG